MLVEPIKLYIDPGTGSMLFAILIGIVGALGYILRGLIVKLKFVLTGGKKVDMNSNKIPLVIFSDDKRYWSVFKPVCEELNKRGVDVVYMTASPDDPVLESEYKHIRPEFIGEGNKAFSKLNFLNASLVLSTTPGLDVYQWKKSKNVDYYVHMLHAAGDVTGYKMFGIDYYDAVLLSGEYQVKDIRTLEKQRNLPAKELVKVGIPYMDEMVKRLNSNSYVSEHERTVLLAPSWGQSAIFSKYKTKILDELIKTGYRIIVRPHPQSFASEKEMMDELMNRYPESNQLEWNRDSDNFEVLKRADILISDFSGVIYDFSLVYDKPIIYADTEFDNSPYDAWWIDEPFWSFTALPKLGEKLTESNLSDIKNIIDACIENEKYSKGRNEVRAETWEHFGKGVENAVDYLIETINKLTAKEAE